MDRLTNEPAVRKAQALAVPRRLLGDLAALQALFAAGGVADEHTEGEGIHDPVALSRLHEIRALLERLVGPMNQLRELLDPELLEPLLPWWTPALDVPDGGTDVSPGCDSCIVRWGTLKADASATSSTLTLTKNYAAKLPAALKVTGVVLVVHFKTAVPGSTAYTWSSVQVDLSAKWCTPLTNLAANTKLAIAIDHGENGLPLNAAKWLGSVPVLATRHDAADVKNDVETQYLSKL